MMNHNVCRAFGSEQDSTADPKVVWGKDSWKEFDDALTTHPWFVVRMGYRRGLTVCSECDTVPVYAYLCIHTCVSIPVSPYTTY